MSDEIGAKSDNAEDGPNIDETQNENETKEPKDLKQRSVSFNRDVHVKRFGIPRESRGSSTEPPTIRKEPFTHLSEQEIIKEANKVRAQAESVTCTADHPPDKFYSLPNRKKRDNRLGRTNFDEGAEHKSLGRSTSDLGSRKRVSLSTLFRKAQKHKNPETSLKVNTKPVVTVKRSKSDVSDLKSNTNLNINPKPIRKRSGSETEEFLKSLRNKKTQLSPIIENSPRDDYFRKTPPLDAYQKNLTSQKENTAKEDQKSIEKNKVNPIEKPPRYKSPEKTEPKPPVRSKRGKSSEKDLSPSIGETPRRKTEPKKTILVDEIDSKIKEISPVKDKIKTQIKKIEENIYGGKEMLHSSQQPPAKPPLTRGGVENIVRKLRDDHNSPPPISHLITPSHGTNINQPFSYTKPSHSPDPNLFIRTTSPDRVPTPVNTMNDKGVVYAQVIKENGSHTHGKPTVHSLSREKYGNFSDEDEGLGYEDKYKYSPNLKTNQNFKISNKNDNFNSFDTYKITDSPIKPRFREYKLTSFEDFEPTYANEYPQEDSKEYIETFRGRADGMDTKNKYETEIDKGDLDFNELSHRRQLLESRLNARTHRKMNEGETITRYLAETDPIYEANKRMKATEKYVNETARYYRHTLERDGFTESSVTEDYNKFDSDNKKVKYNTETRTFSKVPRNELDRREFIEGLDHKYNKKDFPPEPEYEPPSLEITPGKPIVSPNEYKEKKYKMKKHLTSSHDVLHSGQKYKTKDKWFGGRKGHYASNPEIANEREDDYANLPHNPESYHNSLRRPRKFYKEDHGVKRHDSGDSRDYYRDDRSPRRFDNIDSRLVDSGIENDFRKDSNLDIHKPKYRRHDTDDDVRDTSLFLASERRHTEDNYYPSEQIYSNGGYEARFHGDNYRSPSRPDEKVNAKPPKAKKLSGLEKVKQLFSRDSSKKSKKEKEPAPSKLRTRVLKSPEPVASSDAEYKRYTDPEPSDMDVKKKEYDPKELDRRYTSSREDRYRSSDEDRYRSSKEDDRYRSSKEDDRYRSSKEDDRYRSSKEDVRYRSSNENDRYRSSEDERYRSDPERKYGVVKTSRYERTVKEERRRTDQKEKHRQNSSDRESDLHSRPSDSEARIRSRTTAPLDSPALAERNRGRRRLATPSPPRRDPPASASKPNWFKSLDRLTRRRGNINKVEKESILTPGDPRKWSKPTKPLTSPAKNLRFFGDTDQESDAKQSSDSRRGRTTLRKTISNSSTGIDEIDRSQLNNKSYSLSNLHRVDKSESPPTKPYYKRNLHNISEVQSSETNSQLDRRARKPPISPYDRRSRSHSSSKTLRADVRPSPDARGSKLDIRDKHHRRRTPHTSGESSTEGESSHHSNRSNRSVVFLHATTVGDIPSPARLARSRDDVSSLSSAQVRTNTKSFSLFAPWTPRMPPETRDVHYVQKARRTPVKPSNLSTLSKKSSSQTTLTRKTPSSRLSSSSTTLYRKPDRTSRENLSVQNSTLTRRRDKSQSNEALTRSGRDKISRSISMPKDNSKKAGWFKLTNKNKKQEINSRVR